MLVEFIGCTGAGKTTLIGRLEKRLLFLGFNAISSTQLIAKTTKTYFIKNERLRNIILDWLLLPQFIRAVTNHSQYIFFALKTIYIESYSVYDALNRARSLIRQLGGMSLLKMRTNNFDFVLIDEGTVSSAYNLFAHVNAPPRASAVSKFAKFVPLPDLLVHVDVDVDTAMKRTLERIDPPSIIKRKPLFLKRQYVVNMCALFDILGKQERIKNRLLSVLNKYKDDSNALAERIIIILFDKMASQVINK